MEFQQRLQLATLQFLPFIVAVVVHEYGHGFMANRYGDSTAKKAGRLTFNPMMHIDPIGTILFPLINMVTGIPVLFGWAKPVPINPSRFKPFKQGMFWVSFAGPLSNFIFALIFAFAFVALIKFLPENFEYAEPLITMCRFGVYINLGLGLFNLIPLPPLDGSKMIAIFMKPETERKFESLQQWSFWILLALMWTGALRVIYAPVEWIGSSMVSLCARLLGVG